MNFLSLNDYRNAILLALAMEQPARLLSLFKKIQSEDIVLGPSITGHPAVDEVIRTLSGPDLARLLRYVRDWNANAKNSGVAQRVLHAAMKLRTAEDIMGAFGEQTLLSAASGDNKGLSSVSELVDALLPYTERHLARMERLLQDSYVVEFILAEMDDGVFGDEFDDADVDVVMI